MLQKWPLVFASCLAVMCLVCIAEEVLIYSLDGLAYLADFELETTAKLQNVLRRHPQLEFVRKFIIDSLYDPQDDLASYDEPHYKQTNHVIDIFVFVKRWHKHYPQLLTKLNKFGYNVSQFDLEPLPFSVNETFYEAAEQLIRMVFRYELNASEFLEGSTFGVRSPTGTKLTVEDLFDLMDKAMAHSDYDIAAKFIDAVVEALTKSSRSKQQNFVDRFKQLIVRYNLFPNVSQHQDQILRIKNPTRIMRHCQEHIRQMIKEPSESMFGEFCARASNTSEFKIGIHNLTCDYYFPRHPYYRIGPVKREVLSHDPEMVQFHDVLSESEIRAAHEEAIENMEMGHIDGKAPRMDYSVRNSQVAWLDEDKFSWMLKRVTMIGNFEIDHSDYRNFDVADGVQYSRYQPGTFYSLHYDAGLPTAPYAMQHGQRLATFMFYLNDVKYGGETVFPQNEIRQKPKRGSALLWYNIFPNYELDGRTLHGGCPVLLGQKAVINIWIRSHQNMFRYPCYPSEENPHLGAPFKLQNK